EVIVDVDDHDEPARIGDGVAAVARRAGDPRRLLAPISSGRPRGAVQARTDGTRSRSQYRPTRAGAPFGQAAGGAASAGGGSYARRIAESFWLSSVTENGSGTTTAGGGSSNRTTGATASGMTAVAAGGGGGRSSGCGRATGRSAGSG